MGFISFLRKITKKNKLNELKKEPQKIDFKGLADYIESKRKEIEYQEKEIFSMIKDETALVILELNEKLQILESVDIESKKVEHKIKLIVKENLNNYIGYVKNFIENLGSLREEQFEKFVGRINNIFLDFDKKSHLSYQKVTFLIGKEIADIKNKFVDFSKYLTKIINENKEIVDSSEIISFIALKLNQMDKINETIAKMNEKITALDEKIKNLKELNEKILEEIEKIRKSKSYLENLNKQEEAKSDEKELEKEICNLKNIIDFKKLANVFHVDRKKIEIIKNYKKEFQESFQKDNGTSILKLLEEAKLNNQTILDKIKQINLKKEKIIKNIDMFKEDESGDLVVKSNEIKSEIKSLDNEKIIELKICEKLKINRKELINLINQEISKMNISILREDED